MAVVFPSRKTRMIIDILCFLLCFLVTAGQSALLDYYFLRYLEGQNAWYAWIAGDVLVLGIMLWLLIIAIRYNQRCMEEVCSSGESRNPLPTIWRLVGLQAGEQVDLFNGKRGITDPKLPSELGTQTTAVKRGQNLRKLSSIQISIISIQTRKRANRQRFPTFSF